MQFLLISVTLIVAVLVFHAVTYSDALTRVVKLIQCFETKSFVVARIVTYLRCLTGDERDKSNYGGCFSPVGTFLVTHRVFFTIN